MGLFLFELKKAISSRFLWGMVLLLLILDIYVIYTQCRGNDSIDGHELIYEQVKGEITLDKINFVAEHYKNALRVVQEGNYSTKPNQKGTYTGFIFGDMSEFQYFYEELKYHYFYEGRIQDVLNQAASNINFYENIDNRYEVRKNQKIIDIYKKRSLNSFYEMKNMQEYLEYDYSCGFLLLLLFLATPNLFWMEKQIQMELLLKTSKIGIRKIACAKLAAVSAISLFFTTLFGATDFITFQFIYGLEGFRQPVYSIQDYAFSIINIPIWQYALLLQLFRFLACIGLGMFLSWLSAKLTDNVMIMAIGLAVIGNLILCCIYTDFLYNPLLLFEMNQICRNFQVIALMAYPVYQYQIILFATIGMSILLSADIIYTIKNKRFGFLHWVYENWKNYIKNN